MEFMGYFIIFGLMGLMVVFGHLLKKINLGVTNNLLKLVTFAILFLLGIMVGNTGILNHLTNIMWLEVVALAFITLVITYMAMILLVRYLK